MTFEVTQGQAPAILKIWTNTKIVKTGAICGG